MTEYYHLQADDDISLVVDHEVLETPGKYIDGEVYVDYETVHDRFNDRFTGMPMKMYCFIHCRIISLPWQQAAILIR